jgi:peptidoglycan hydrolase-like protein with peptidoglycan-binding domain
MQTSGQWTRESGESMEAYSKNNDGVWGSIVGFGGRVNKAVGGAIESMAGGKSAPEGGDASAPAAGTPVQVNTATYVTTAPPSEPAAPAAAAAAPADPVALTARAQARLQELGYAVGKADGVLGPKTRAALQKYQRAKGLTVTGTLDQATLASLGLA